MTRIDFYLLPQDDEAARWQFACRLVEKAWRLGNRLLVHTGNHRTAQHLDSLLWSFRPDSFVPHELTPGGKRTPVHIGWGDDSPEHHDLLVNLGENIPAFFSRYERVAEIVSAEPGQRAESRQRYRFYRERGYELQLHDLAKRT